MEFSFSTAAEGSFNGGFRFSRRCASDEVPGMSKMFGARWRSQASAPAWGCLERFGDLRQGRRLQRREAAEREEGT